MPTYEYRCKQCGTELEAVQSFTDDALTTCESCGGELRKLFGRVGIAFKGSGFYKTDSRTGSGGSSKESSDGASSDKPSEKTSGTTTAPTSDTKAGKAADKKAAKAPAASSTSG